MMRLRAPLVRRCSKGRTRPTSREDICKGCKRIGAEASEGRLAEWLNQQIGMEDLAMGRWARSEERAR